MCEALTRLADTRRLAALRVYVNAPSYDDLAESRRILDRLRGTGKAYVIHDPRMSDDARADLERLAFGAATTEDETPTEGVR